MDTKKILSIKEETKLLYHLLDKLWAGLYSDSESRERN